MKLNFQTRNLKCFPAFKFNIHAIMLDLKSFVKILQLIGPRSGSVDPDRAVWTQIGQCGPISSSVDPDQAGWTQIEQCGPRSGSVDQDRAVWTHIQQCGHRSGSVDQDQTSPEGPDPVCHSVCIFWTQHCMVIPYCSKFRIIILFFFNFHNNLFAIFVKG